MKKVYCLLLVLFLLSLFFFLPVEKTHAQVGQIWETIIGNPTEDINTDPGDSGGGSGGTDGKYVFYCQWSDPWRNVTFNDGTIAKYGCGPTSMAMIFSSFGVTKKPDYVAKQYDRYGFSWLSGNPYGYHGSNLWDVTSASRQNWLNNQGFSSARLDVELNTSANIDSAKKFIERGYLLYGGAIVNSWAGFSGGHSFVVTGVVGSTPNEVKMKVIDPNDARSCLRKNVITIDNSTISKWYFLVPIRKL